MTISFSNRQTGVCGLLASLLIGLALLPSQLWAQSLTCNGAAEAFDSFPPSGWTVATNEPAGPQWSDLTACGESGNYTNGSGGVACVSSDNFGTAEFDTSLLSPSFDLSGVPSATLSYTANYQNLASFDFLDLDISTDGGSTWTTLLSWNSDMGSFRAQPGVDVNIDLAAYTGQSNLQVRWRYYDPNTGDWGWYAQIDNVALSCGAGASNIDVAVSSLSATQNTNTTTSQILAIGNTGGGDLHWTIDEEALPRPARYNDAGGSVTKRGAPTPHSVSPQQVAKLLADRPTANSVQDSSFEAGTPNPEWTEYSLNFGTTLCDTAGCGTGAGSAYPRTGDWWSWFGGASSVEEGSVSQNVTIPSGSNVLSFWVMNGLCSGDVADYLEVTLDGNQLWQTTGAAAECGTTTYRQISLDITAYADGASHALEFHSETQGTDTTNFSLDDVVIDAAPSCSILSNVPWLASSPSSGTTIGGGSTAVTVSFDSTGVAAGTYNANLCISSDDPTAGPGNGTALVVVPVSLTVNAAPPALIPTFGPWGKGLLILSLGGLAVLVMRRR
jgi:hypothetical protein